MVAIRESLGLELVLTSPSPPPSDATNYLGGVGDVLEAKSHRGELTHLADLATVALYDNDRQFHDVRYSWQVGQAVEYTVRIWVRSPRRPRHRRPLMPLSGHRPAQTQDWL